MIRCIHKRHLHFFRIKIAIIGAKNSGWLYMQEFIHPPLGMFTDDPTGANITKILPCNSGITLHRISDDPQMCPNIVSDIDMEGGLICKL